MFARLSTAREPGPRDLPVAVLFLLVGVGNVWALIHESGEAEGVSPFGIVALLALGTIAFLVGTYFALPGHLRRTKMGLEVAYNVVSLAFLATMLPMIIWLLLT